MERLWRRCEAGLVKRACISDFYGGLVGGDKLFFLWIVFDEVHTFFRDFLNAKVARSAKGGQRKEVSFANFANFAFKKPVPTITSLPL
jgi:hypothetical protein